MADVAAQVGEMGETLESVVDSLGMVTGRLEAQASGLQALEDRLSPPSTMAEPRFPDHPAVRRQSELAADGVEGVDIGLLLDGGNVEATEGLGVSAADMKSKLFEVFGVSDEDMAAFEASGYNAAKAEADAQEAAFRESIASHMSQVEADLFKRALAQDTPGSFQGMFDEAVADTSEDTEQALLRVATRCYYLDMAEQIMESQPGNNLPPALGGTRSGYVADAQTAEHMALFPLLYTWVRERGWLP